MAVLSAHSCLVNACQGYDSYQRWLSNKHPAFTVFLALYCTIYTLDIAYEGKLVYHANTYIHIPECNSCLEYHTCLLDSLLFGSCLIQVVSQERRVLRKGTLLFSYWSQNQAQNVPMVFKQLCIHLHAILLSFICCNI